MSSRIQPSQVLLSATILASTIGTYIALSPPKSKIKHTASSSDSLAALGLTSTSFANLTLTPLFVLSIHHALLTFFYPFLPKPLLGHGPKNGLNPDLLTWSTATIVPLILILFVGIPLRLVPFSTLADDFTFFLTSPEKLTTNGIYAYVQHPSYVGLFTLVVTNFVLLGRTDGVVTCWYPPWVLKKLKVLVKRLIYPLVVAAVGVALWTRVLQEETLLRQQFGREWEVWHEQTARFVPGVF